MSKQTKETWSVVRIKQSTLDKINNLMKTNKEFDSAANFVDESVILRLTKYEGCQ